MKKLLILLSVVTISGTAMPSVIAASSYKKEEIIKRDKRENSNNFYINGEIYVDKQNGFPFPITTMYTFDKNTNGRKIGDIYFLTTNGIYLRTVGNIETIKIEDNMTDLINTMLEQEKIEQNEKYKEEIQSNLNNLIKNETNLEKDIEIKNIKLNEISKNIEDNKQKINELIILDKEYINKVIEYTNKIKILENAIEKNIDLINELVLTEILIESKQNYIELKTKNEKLINETKIKINKIKDENEQLEKDMKQLKNYIVSILEEKTKLENKLKIKIEEFKKLENNSKLYLLSKTELINKINEERSNFQRDCEEHNNQIKKQKQEIETLKIKIKQLEQKEKNN